MLPLFLQRERDELLKRLRPGTPHTDTFRRAIEGCFDLAGTTIDQKKSMSMEPGLTTAQRKAEMAKVVDGDLLPRLASLTQPARKAKAQVAAERKKYQSGYVPEDVAGLFNDVGCVEAATYFAQREMQPASAMSTYDLHMLMTDGAS